MSRAQDLGSKIRAGMANSGVVAKVVCADLLALATQGPGKSKARLRFANHILACAPGVVIINKT